MDDKPGSMSMPLLQQRLQLRYLVLLRKVGAPSARSFGFIVGTPSFATAWLKRPFPAKISTNTVSPGEGDVTQGEPTVPRATWGAVSATEVPRSSVRPAALHADGWPLPDPLPAATRVALDLHLHRSLDLRALNTTMLASTVRTEMLTAARTLGLTPALVPSVARLHRFVPRRRPTRSCRRTATSWSLPLVLAA